MPKIMSAVVVYDVLCPFNVGELVVNPSRGWVGGGRGATFCSDA